MTNYQRAKRLYRICKAISAEGRSYVYGGGHGVPLADMWASEHAGEDCSASVCMALKRASLYGPTNAPMPEVVWNHDYATDSTHLMKYGEPGKGRWITIYASPTHAWIKFEVKRWFFWRFDTSPWGDGGSGPRVRVLPRTTTGFVARHPRGL